MIEMIEFNSIFNSIHFDYLKLQYSPYSAFNSFTFLQKLHPLRFCSLMKMVSVSFSTSIFTVLSNLLIPVPFFLPFIIRVDGVK